MPNQLTNIPARTTRRLALIVLLVALSAAFGFVLRGTTPPTQVFVRVPYKMLVEVPHEVLVERPTRCVMFDLLAFTDSGFVRTAQQELCGQALVWNRAVGPSFNEALALAENERDAWRDCALDRALCASWQK